jgi:hypothetical protein
MPPVAVHFNGGVNLPDADVVLRELVGRVPDGVRTLPDGETGDRAGWIAFQLPRLLATPGLERVDPSPDGRPTTRRCGHVGDLHGVQPGPRRARRRRAPARSAPRDPRAVCTDVDGLTPTRRCHVTANGEALERRRDQEGAMPKIQVTPNLSVSIP